MSDVSALLTQYAPVLRGATFVGIVTGVAKGFKWFDKVLSPQGRSSLSLWLKNVPGDEQIDTWGNIFPDLINRVFGPRALSFRFIFRSCVASFLAVAVSFAMICVYFGVPVTAPETSDKSATFFFTLLIMLTLTVNCVPDYFSLLVSRFIVRLMSRRPTLLRCAGLLLLDTALTLTLALLSLSLTSLIADLVTRTRPADDFLHHPFGFAFSEASDLLSSLPSNPALWIFILASLFTSIWVWLYVLASVSIRIVHKVRFVWVRVVPFLNVDKKPMQAIGRIAGLIAGLLYGAGLAGVRLYQHL
jgi:hypothetical protein